MKNYAVLAIASILASGAAFATTPANVTTSEGYVLSAPPLGWNVSNVDRQKVRDEAVAAVQQNLRDPLAAEGRGSIKPQPGSMRTRAQVRVEAFAAAHQNYHDPLGATGERGGPAPWYHGSDMSASAD